MKTCCDALNWLISYAGKAGLSVVVRKLGDAPAFAIQARACHADQEGRFAHLPKGVELPQPLRIAVQTGIKYCPFCGTRLADLLDDRSVEVSRLIEAHRQLVLE